MTGYLETHMHSVHHWVFILACQNCMSRKSLQQQQQQQIIDIPITIQQYTPKAIKQYMQNINN